MNRQTPLSRAGRAQNKTPGGSTFFQGRLVGRDRGVRTPLPCFLSTAGAIKFSLCQLVPWSTSCFLEFASCFYRRLAGLLSFQILTHAYVYYCLILH